MIFFIGIGNWLYYVLNFREFSEINENFPIANQDFENDPEPFIAYNGPNVNEIESRVIREVEKSATIHLNEPTTFKRMFPPETTSKRQAASGFAKLLRKIVLKCVLIN